MKISVKYQASFEPLKMVKLDNGELMNYGGRSLPF